MKVWNPSRPQRRANSSASRVLPTPGSPPIMTRRARPAFDLGDELAQLSSLRLPAHKRRPPREGGAGLSRLGRVVDHPVEVPSVREAFQPQAAPVGEGELGTGPGQLPHNLGDEDLPAFGPAGDAGGSIDGLAVDVVALDDDLTGVDADANPQLLAGGLDVALLQPLLDGDGARQGLRVDAKATMNPSPSALISRPSCSPTQRRTTSSWDRRIRCATASPRSVRRSVDPSTSLKRIVIGPSGNHSPMVALPTTNCGRAALTLLAKVLTEPACVRAHPRQ